MKVSYQKLLSLLVEKPRINLLSEKLFQLGHEHEVHENIFNMELTPNRGDCLSVLGLARDLNIFFGLNESIDVFSDPIEELDFNFKNLSPEDCPKITFLEIEIEDEVTEYKEYLQDYFLISENNKTNFFTDISNYISYELGQPTHCFDSNKIPNKLTFEKKNCNESFKTLLDQDISLKDKNCVFKVGDEIVSLAGVMGGKSTACSPETKKVLIECAYFKPESIIGKTIKYNITSDAAFKFERGVDIACHDIVLRRFIKIVQDHVSIKSLKIKTFEDGNHCPLYISKDVSKINDILGININEAEYCNYLNKLGFLIDERIKVPSYRHNIFSQNDLAEEVARSIGYDNIQKKPINLKAAKKNKKNKIDLVRSYLTEKGFSEVINFPFTEKNSESSIKIDNPLDSNKKNLRTSLKNSLIENLLYNERRQKDSIKIFEISDIYKNSTNLEQEMRLGIIISGRVGENYMDYSKKLDKNFLNEVLKNNNAFLIEEISREGIKTKKKDKIFYTEILLSDIPEKLSKNTEFKSKPFKSYKFEAISEFPSSKRDFSFSITNLDKYNELLNYVENFQDGNLKKAFIFDFYKNKKLNEIKLGVSFIFQSSRKTLSEDEIQESISKLLEPIKNLDGVTVPGLDLK